MSTAGADIVHLTAKQAAAYLQLNEKKLYQLARAREIPAARVGGKWLFPRALLDRWLLEQAHGGLFADRLLVGGAEDPLLHEALLALGARLGGEALVAHVPTDTAAGLEQLAHHRIDAAAFHWGAATESGHQHAALLRRQPGHTDWTAVRIAWREHGILLRRGLEVDDLHTLAGFDYRWALQAPGAGSRYALQLALAAAGFRLEDCGVALRVPSARAAAAAVARGAADCAPGPAALAAEHGLGFVALGVEALDLALPRAVFFRHLFQSLIETLADTALRAHAEALGGYDLSPLGRVVALDASDSVALATGG